MARKEQSKNKTNIRDIIREAMDLRGYTNQMIADSMGYSSRSGVAMILSGRRIRVDTAVKVLDILGFDVIVKDRKASNKENCWKLDIIESEDDEDGDGDGE